MKNKLFDDLKTKKEGSWIYQFVDEADIVSLLKTVSPKQLEKLCNSIQFDKDSFILIPKGLKNVESFFKKKNTAGKPVQLSNGEFWIVTTIENVHRVFTLDEKFQPTLQPLDPLFDKLIDFSRNYQEKSFDEILDIISECFSRNYYVNKNILLALKLITTENLNNIIETIFLLNKEEEATGDNSEDLFQSTAEDETK